MSKFKTLPISKIHVSKNRSREVDEDHALAIQASIVEQDQITPIMIRPTPNGKRPYELIAGAHRYRAIELLDGDEEIDAVIVSADKEEAAILEVSENIFRNELTALDRAMAVQLYRDSWEKKYGKVQRGKPKSSKSANLADLVQKEAEGGFATSCADRLGLSKRAVERSTQIVTKLPKDLRQKLQGTPAANNQSQLEKLVKLPPEKLKKAAEVIETVKGDVAAAIDVLEDKKKVNRTRDEKLLSTLIDTWGRCSPKVRKQFMEYASHSKSETPKD